MGVRGKKGRSREDPGEIHRSKEFGVQGCRRKYEEGRCWGREQGMRIRARGGQGEGRGKEETRTVMHGGVLGNSVESDEGD